MLFRRPASHPLGGISSSIDNSQEVEPLHHGSNNHNTTKRRHSCCCYPWGPLSLRFQCGLCLCFSLLLVNIVYMKLFIPLSPLTLDSLPQNKEPFDLPSTQLHIVTVSKESGHAVVEWLLNLYSQGFDHVTLVDNMSQRPLPLDVLNHLTTIGFLTLKYQKGTTIQKKALRWASQWSRWKGADWILQVDDDEFPWATQVGSVQNYLTLRDPEVCTVAFPWRLFASDGRDDQPNSLVRGFSGRFNFTKQKEQNTAYKTAARTDCSLLWMAVHHAALLPRDSLRGYAATGGFPRNDSPALDARTEQIVPDVLINHYRLQSRRFFLEIKQYRGNSINNGKVRDEKSFQGGDHNDIVDHDLMHKVSSRFPALYQPDLAVQANTNFTSPWPMSNVLQALEELKRHQVLVIMDADHTVPDALATATRNAAILDPTLDCVVRVPPGHVRSILHSQLLEFCKVYEAFPETPASWRTFVQARISEYHHKYQGFVVMDQSARLPYGMETAPLRRAALAAGATWKEWTTSDDHFVDGSLVQPGSIRVLGK
jgi:hypothetical protein